MSNWGSDYDGFAQVNKKTRTHANVTDKHGRVMPAKPAADVPMRRFAETVDRDKLELFVDARSTGDDKFAAFLVALHDPDHANLTFATICRKFGVTLHELQTLYTDGMRQMALMEAATVAPKVMADVGINAQNSLVLCSRCDGRKVVTEVLERDDKGKVVRTVDRQCPVCEGVGKVTQMGDEHAQDVVFEAMKITGQKSPLIAQQFNLGGSGGNDGLDAGMEGMLKMTQGVTMNVKPEPKQETT